RLLAIGNPAKDVAIDGVRTVEPSFGLPAIWISPEDEARAREAGLSIVDPITALITHFGEIAGSEMATLVTRPVVTRLLEEVRQRQPGLIEELIPGSLSIADVQRVLQNLLAENVSIANIDLIVEHLADLARNQRDPAELTEQIRQRLS
ncbi:flagellar biosynthesis protein FlhA, partial [Rhizobium leguminosarum]|uniref:FHIPEP family type III secretion protein n=1 Tax=Rhizobium ruizarguesonis TaxID=2081791 RepID=UPI0013DE86DC